MIEKRRGVVIIPIDERGNVYAIPSLAENAGKRERVVGRDTLYRAVVGKREYPAGASEERDGVPSPETLTLVAAREFAEETGIILNLDPRQLLEQDLGFTVDQIRGGKEVQFQVSVFTYCLTVAQLDWITNVVGATKVDYDNEAGMCDLRPRDEFVTNLIMRGEIPLFEGYAQVDMYI